MRKTTRGRTNPPVSREKALRKKASSHSDFRRGSGPHERGSNKAISTTGSIAEIRSPTLRTLDRATAESVTIGRSEKWTLPLRNEISEELTDTSMSFAKNRDRVSSRTVRSVMSRGAATENRSVCRTRGLSFAGPLLRQGSRAWSQPHHVAVA